MKRSIAGTCVAVLLAAAALPAAAASEVDFFVNVAPPPLRHEIAPAPRAGHVWVPGYWDWRYKKYQWVRGRWQAHRPGYVYQPVRWEYRGGHYYRHAAGWHDSDHDGVPNRYDRAPRNPTRF